MPGGLLSNPAFCRPGQLTAQRLLGYADVSFGGRDADYRFWSFTCVDGHNTLLAQYVVNRGPGYIILSQRAETESRKILAAMAAGSVLPAARTPLRYSDLGVVTTRTRRPGGWAITLDRAVDALGVLINRNPATYPYVVPDAALVHPSTGPVPANTLLAIGGAVRLQTDGVTVTHVSRWQPSPRPSPQ